MTTPRRLAVVVATFAVTLALTAPSPRPVDPRRERLEAMPREERLRLDANLKAFDKLPPAEQAAVRTLDRALDAEPGENRANYEGVLRRYHLWLRGLTEAQRNELASRPPEKRMAVVTKLLAEPHATGRRESLVDQVADIGGVSQFDLANAVKVWLQLTPAEQAVVAKLPENERRPRLMQISRLKQVKPVRRPNRDELEALVDRAVKKGVVAPLKKAEETKKQDWVRQRVAESYYFLENPPPKVAPDRLLQFDRALPPWLRAGIADIPPGEARRLLTNLYRLIFPAPEEMGTAKPPAPSADGTASKSSVPPPNPLPVRPKAANPPPLPKPAAPTNPY